MWDYPSVDGPSPFRSHVRVHPPFLNYVSGKKDDVISCLGGIKEVMVEKCGYKLVVLALDQQMFILAQLEMQLRPHEYGWLIIIPGELHFVMHLCHSAYCLYHSSLIDPIQGSC